MQPFQNFNEHLKTSDKNYEEELAERAFSDYYGVDKSLSWRSHYGDRPYSTYWTAAEQDRNAMKEELGIAAQQREASAKAAEMYGSIRSFAVESGLPSKEARALVGNTLVNVFREEHVQTKELREELFWKETLKDHNEVARVSSKFPETNIFTVDLLEECRVEVEDRLKDFALPSTRGFTATDLRPEALQSRFSTWKSWICEIAEKRDDMRVREAAEKMYPEEHAVYDNRDQNFSNDVSQLHNLEKEIVNSYENPAKLESGSATISRVDDDIERIIFGDEKSDLLMLQQDEHDSGDRWASLPPQKEHESDERSR